MPVDPTVAKKERRQIALILGCLLFSLYLFSYRGGFHSIDEVSMFAVTESLAKFGRFNTDQIAWTQWTTSQAEAQGFFGADGHVYSKKGLALSLAQLPLYWLALLLPGLGMLQTVSLLNAIITALSGMLIFMVVDRMNFPRPTSIITTLIFGLATIALVYAKYLFSEPLAGFLLLLAAYMLFTYRQEGGLRHIFIAGLAAGFAVVTRANNLFLIPAFGLYLLWVVQAGQARGREGARQFIKPFLVTTLTFVIALAVPGAILLGYNAVRSGNPLQTGYDLTLFSPNLLVGLYKLLFSPLRGLFVYSPILLLSLPGWWLLRQNHPAESWLFAALVGITLALFSAWSSGEGLSWGSRFLVPIIPFLTIPLAPIIQKITLAPSPPRLLAASFYLLLTLSLCIQFLGVAINPWVYLARLQTDFGGEFFLEKTDALTDFRYSQITGQLQAWSLQNSDIVWWQPWGFDALAFGLSLFLVLLWCWLLWRRRENARRRGHEDPATTPESTPVLNPNLQSLIPNLPLSLILSLILSLSLILILLARYNQTDRQFGPPDDAYTQTLSAAANQSGPGETIITVAQNHYHVAMNRFKARVPLVGLAQQQWPLPENGQALLKLAAEGDNSRLVTVGFAPAAPNNAVEQWLTFNAFKAGETWQPDDVRLVQYGLRLPDTTRPINAVFDNTLELLQVQVLANAAPGQAIATEFTWQPRTRLDANYNLFLQLFNREGALVAQYDGPPNGGYTPTSGWIPGQPITSRQAVPLPANLPPGDYRLIAGLYQPATGQRLPINNGNDFVELGHVAIHETKP